MLLNKSERGQGVMSPGRCGKPPTCQQTNVMPHPFIVGQHRGADQIGQHGADLGRDRHRQDGIQGAAFGLKVGAPFGPFQGRQEAHFGAVAGVQRDVGAGLAVDLCQVPGNDDADSPTGSAKEQPGGLRHVVSLVQVLGK